ncbi:alpha-(1,3)-fucosyltransferase C-like [Argopecten irradians]|uniref:alpha-(1,3)-fucosyltransferase C-like n=1 Tax=Argopecten irradians TaxID=31199 RepID=UPI00371B94E8
MAQWSIHVRTTVTIDRCEGRNNNIQCTILNRFPISMFIPQLEYFHTRNSIMKRPPFSSKTLKCMIIALMALMYCGVVMLLYSRLCKERTCYGFTPFYEMSRLRIEPKENLFNGTSYVSRKTLNISSIAISYKVIDRDVRIHYFNPNQWTGPDTFSKCAHKCSITFGSDYKDYSTSQFVIFDGSSTLPRKPPPKPTGQTWIHYGMEPPFLQPRIQKWRRKFNWTISYRRDADITHTYATMLFKEVKGTERIKLKSNWEEKMRGIAWFVSHRNVPSRRDQFADTLQNFINVDIYSRTGSKKCPSDKIKDCEKMLSDKYKFYLSFENSLCRDYVTEKCFKIYCAQADVIPVVRGVEDYSLFVPPNSFIDTSKFNNISSLAKMQIELANNRTDFENYFQWRRYYYNEPTGSRAFCQLCAEVHRVPVKQRLYDDLDTWVQGDENNQMCRQVVDIK